MVLVIDYITVVKEFEPPREFRKIISRPFDFNGIIYSPKFLNGKMIRYEGELKNLRLSMYPEKIILSNSLHKFWHIGNHQDFNLSEMKMAVEKLNSDTGINWSPAVVKKLEYGCNLKINAAVIVNSLLSYKGKEFLPMQWKGKKYGKTCDFTDYKVKGYDKSIQVKLADKVDLKFPSFRWEISLRRVRSIEKIIQSQLTLTHLLKPEILQILAKDAVSKFQNSLKAQRLNLYDLGIREKLVLAAMMNPQIREDFKIHHKYSYQKYIQEYKHIMSDKRVCTNDDTGDQLEQKFKDLIGANEN